MKADNTTVAAKVSGYVHEVLAGDNETVKAGQILARIDQRDFKMALDQATTDVVAAKSAIASKMAQLEIQQAVIDGARAVTDLDNATPAPEDRAMRITATPFSATERQSLNTGSKLMLRPPRRCEGDHLDRRPRRRDRRLDGGAQHALLLNIEGASAPRPTTAPGSRRHI